MVYFRDNKSPVLRQEWIGNKWREQQFLLDWTEPTLAGLDECVFDEQSWEGGATSPCHKSKWYVLLIISSFSIPFLFSLDYQIIRVISRRFIYFICSNKERKISLSLSFSIFIMFITIINYHLSLCIHIFIIRGWFIKGRKFKKKLLKDFYSIQGKYIVRLYFLGTWRRIVVDDMIPVNKEKLPLLPRANNNFELWPMILSKALLKLCSLTWNNYEIIDFHPVACLTGKERSLLL